MIELVSDARCIGCDICVNVCPTNVFDAEPGRGARHRAPDDCQTCFMCELYCPVDALFVAPDADDHVKVDEAELIASGKLGSYRRQVGWHPETAHLRIVDRTVNLR